MTLVEPASFEEIAGGLRGGGHDVRHLALLARRDTVVKRLRERRVAAALRRAVGGADGAETVAHANIHRCLERLLEPTFAEHIRTDGLDVAAVADRIATSVGLSLRPADSSRRVGRAPRRLGVRHIRW